MSIFLVKRAFSISFVMVLVAALSFAAVEPAITEAVDASDDVVITLNVTAGVSITSPSDATMSAALGVSQNTAVGTTTWNVKTNNSSGYTLTVQASGAPAMTSGGNFINDYQVGTPNTWSATSGAAYFGYSAFGNDTTTGTWGTDSDCSGANGNAISTALKYKGFTTSGVQISSRSATTTTSGIDTTVCYAVEQNGVYVPSGAYTATITATATAS